MSEEIPGRKVLPCPTSSSHHVSNRHYDYTGMHCDSIHPQCSAVKNDRLLLRLVRKQCKYVRISASRSSCQNFANLLLLASICSWDLETQLGATPCAYTERQPGNSWVLATLGHHETIHTLVSRSMRKLKTSPVESVIHSHYAFWPPSYALTHWSSIVACITQVANSTTGESAVNKNWQFTKTIFRRGSGCSGYSATCWREHSGCSCPEKRSLWTQRFTKIFQILVRFYYNAELPS